MEKMLKIKLLSFVIFVFIHFNIHGQNEYIGIIDMMPDPRITVPMNYPPFVYYLTTVSGTYLLTLDLLPIEDLIVEDIQYSPGETVIVTGTTTVKHGSFLEEYYELEIGTIGRSSLSQDIQRFLGTYIIEGVCSDNISPQSYYPVQGEIILSEGQQQDNLFFQMTDVGGKHTFVSGDNLFIPFQWHWYHPSGAMGSFAGTGKIENDSIFFDTVRGSYGYDFSVMNFFTCKCKGKKISSSDIVSVSPPKFDNDKVYYDVIKQVIVIDETLQNQSLTFELADLQGKVMLKQAYISNTSISVANLLSGIYLYRLTNDELVISGKILK